MAVAACKTHADQCGAKILGMFSRRKQESENGRQFEFRFNAEVGGGTSPTLAEHRNGSASVAAFRFYLPGRTAREHS